MEDAFEFWWGPDIGYSRTTGTGYRQTVSARVRGASVYLRLFLAHIISHLSRGHRDFSGSLLLLPFLPSPIAVLVLYCQSFHRQ
jgi:hypothetical protein